MSAEEEYSKAINAATEYIKANYDKSKVSNWHFLYKRIRGLAKFFNVTKIDDLVKQSGSDWVKKAFDDPYFKEYYKLQKNADRLEVLVK